MTALDDQVQAILAGTKGFVLDPYDQATMWQDPTGTVPVTANGQPVGRLAGKWGTAPVVYSAINAGAARPVLTVDGIKFDGVDDLLRSPNLIDTFRNAAGTCVVARLVPGVTVGGEVLMFAGEITTVTRVGMRVQTAALRNEISQVDVTGNITRATQNGILTPGVGIIVAAVSDLVVDRFLRTFADGVATISTALVTPDTIMPDTPSAFAQLGRPNPNNTFYDGALGRVVFYPFAPTPEQRAVFEAWVVETDAPPPTLNFPSNPVTGQVFEAEGVTFVWNGSLWVVLSPASATFATKAEAEAGLRPDVFLSPLRAKEAIAAQVPPPPVYDVGVAICRAWCIYDGVASTILQSFNVASLLFEAAGSHRIFFATPLPDANYIVLANARGRLTGNHPVLAAGLSTTVPNTVDSCRIVTGTTGGVNSNGFNESSSLVHVSFWS